MGQDTGVRDALERMEAALAAVRNRGAGVTECRAFGVDEAGRAAYGGVVRDQLMSVYGVQLPRRLSRVLEEAAVLRLSPEACVEAIGEAYSLRRLPVRR